MWAGANLAVFDIVSVGHLAIDSIFLPDRQTPVAVLGGSAAYVSLAARRLESSVAIISKVGGDFPEAYNWLLTQEGINTSSLSKANNAQTTRYELKYNADSLERTLVLRSIAPPITLDDLPDPLRASAIHISPIAGEVGYEVVEKLKSCADVLSLDPQGLLRSFDSNGNVTDGPLTDMRIMELVDIYKSSLAEIEALTGLRDLDLAVKTIHDHGVKTVIVTSGAKGATIFSEGETHSIPAYKPEKIVDPTGVGDVFIGGFLSEYVRDENILRCGCVGAALASIAIEGIGPTSLGDRETIYRRARELYGKEIKE